VVNGDRERLPEVPGGRPLYPKRLKALLGKNRRIQKAVNLQFETREAAIWKLDPGTRKALQAPWRGVLVIRCVDTLPGAIVEQAATG
jgi:hypothetical protein